MKTVEAATSVKPMSAWSLAHPAVIYALVWATALVLLRLRLTPVLLPVSHRVLSLLLASVLSSIAMGVIAARTWPMPVETSHARRVELDELGRWSRVILIIWIVGTVFEIIVGRGVPLQWLAMGDRTRDYRNFGVSSLHGFLMAMYFATVTITAIEWWIGRRSRPWQLLALLAWPLVMMNRAAIMWALLQAIAVYLLARERLRWRTVATLIVVLVASLWLFGAVGVARATPDVPQALRAETTGPFAAKLPIGVLWAYVYVTSPINNVVYGTEHLEPVGAVHFSVAALVPTVLRVRLFDSTKRFPLQMADPRFNTATWFAAFLADFGFFGAFAATTVLLMIAAAFYSFARAGQIWAVLGYSACFQAVALSIFADSFTSLVCIAQLLLALAFRVRVRSLGAFGESDSEGLR